MAYGLLIAVAAAGVWWGGHKTVQGVKKIDHKIAHAIHHKKPASMPGPASTPQK